MTHRRLVVGGTAAAIAAAVLLFAGLDHGPALGEPSVAGPSLAKDVPPAAAAVAVGAPAQAGGGNTATEIESLQAEAKANPRKASSLAQLGLAYEQRARE